MPKTIPQRSTPSRKKQHVHLTVTRDVAFRGKSTGLEAIEFVNNALPELNLSEVDTSTVFLGRKVSAPLMVSCMTGGYKEALRINRALAEACEELRLPLGVGSQRQALESTDYHRTFSIARDAGHSIPIIGNIGAAEVAQLKNADTIRTLADLIRADAFAVHLNPLQEFLQPEGNTNFRGVMAGIKMLVRSLPIPIIVKEIGAGISADVAQRLLDAGVRYIDVAGAGGTSWAGVELLRRKGKEFGGGFWDWGIPTAKAVQAVAQLKASHHFTLIASGGIASGLDVAKCIALGADMVASARPVLKTLHKGNTESVLALLRGWIQELRGAMFLTGSAALADLRRAPIAGNGEP